MGDLSEEELWQKAREDRAQQEIKKKRGNRTEITLNYAEVTAPYNFIEPPDRVLDTPWKNTEPTTRDGTPSHCLPVAEAISGTLDIDWTFETKFLIGAAELVRFEDKDYSVHVEYDGKKVIPGSSIRGMLRNVLEIATASRVGHIDRETRFSFRDWENKSDLGRRWLKAVHKNGKPNNIEYIKGGYLVPPTADALNKKHPTCSDWRMVPCDHLARIDIDEAYAAIMGTSTLPAGWENLSINDRYQSITPNIHTPIMCHVGSRKNHIQSKGADWLQAVPIATKNAKFQLASGSPVKEGQVALVGDGKDNSSWLFMSGANENNAFDVPPHVINIFIQAHSGITGDRGALAFWRDDLTSNGSRRIPVVYVDHRNDSEKSLAADSVEARKIGSQQFFISLSRFLKMPHALSVGEMAEKSAPAFHKNYNGPLDFVQALFGHVPADDVAPDIGKPQTQAWKTRVFFRHGEQKNPNQNIVRTSDKDCVTESPRASFSPYYLRPKPGASNNHWSDQNTKLAGVKRYPVRKTPENFPKSKEENSNHGSNMKFYEGKNGDEVAFTAPLKVHNIHPVELGGLLWAISFSKLDADEKVWRHALGRGKPQGRGRLRGELSKFDLTTGMGTELKDADLNDFVNKFQDWLANGMKNDKEDMPDFNAIEHIEELRAMADPEIGHALNDRLQYPNETGNKAADASLKGYGIIKDYAKISPSLHLWRYPRARK